jgi:hypothetical protein
MQRAQSSDVLPSVMKPFRVQWIMEGFHKWGYSNSWMVFVGENTTTIDENWGYQQFRKPPYIDSSGYIDIQIPNTSKYILHGFLFPLGHSHVGFVDGESLDGSFHSKASAVHSACDLRPDAPNIGPASVLHVDGGLSSHPF